MEETSNLLKIFKIMKQRIDAKNTKEKVKNENDIEDKILFFKGINTK